MRRASAPRSDTALTQAQYSEGRSEPQRHTSVVVNGGNRRMTVFEDGEPVAEGRVEISGTAPLPEIVHTLVASDQEKGDLRWVSTGYGKSDCVDLTRELRRIKAEHKVREAMRTRMHDGMSVVTTQTASSTEYRGSEDFVVIDGIY